MSASTIASLLPTVWWTVLSGVAYTAGDILLRNWLAEPFRAGFALVLIVYMTGTACMMFSFFGQNIALATVAAIVVNVMTYLAYASLVFGDTVSAVHIAGLVLGLIAFALLELA